PEHPAAIEPARAERPHLADPVVIPRGTVEQGGDERLPVVLTRVVLLEDGVRHRGCGHRTALVWSLGRHRSVVSGWRECRTRIARELARSVSPRALAARIPLARNDNNPSRPRQAGEEGGRSARRAPCRPRAAGLDVSRRRHGPGGGISHGCPVLEAVPLAGRAGSVGIASDWPRACRVESWPLNRCRE